MLFVLILALLPCTAVSQSASGLVIDGSVAQLFAPTVDGGTNVTVLNVGLPHRRGAVAVEYEGKVPSKS